MATDARHRRQVSLPTTRKIFVKSLLAASAEDHNAPGAPASVMASTVTAMRFRRFLSNSVSNSERRHSNSTCRFVSPKSLASSINLRR